MNNDILQSKLFNANDKLNNLSTLLAFYFFSMESLIRDISDNGVMPGDKEVSGHLDMNALILKELDIVSDDFGSILRDMKQ